MQLTDFNIFEFDQAGAFLQHVLAKKRERSKESQRGFAKRAGFRSSATLSMVLNGKRAITPDVAQKLVNVLKLRGRKRRYFLGLAKLSQARTSDETARYKEELLNLKSAGDTAALPLAQYRFLANWYYVALYVLVGTPSFRRDDDLLAKRLGRGIKPETVAAAIDDMVALGMLRQTEAGLKQIHGPALKTSQDILNLAAQKYLKDVLQLAAEALDLPVDAREVTGLTIAMSPKRLPEVKERIRKFREELDQYLDSFRDGDEVYQLNLQFFPITKTNKENKQ